MRLCLLRVARSAMCELVSLWTKPYQNRTKQREKIGFNRDSSGNSVVPTPFSSSNCLPELNYTETVGPEIYIIGGPVDEKPSSSVQILDCRSHTWRNAPNMAVARKHACTSVLDEKIYVMGGCDIDEYSANWIEVFDMKAQSWTALPGPGADEEELLNHLRNFDSIYIVNVSRGKFYLAADEKDYTYDPKDGTWKLVRDKSSFLPYSVHVWCEMENLICCCTDSGWLMWSGSETEAREWREIKGLEKLRRHPTKGLGAGDQFGMVGCGGKLLVMWDHYPTASISGTKRRNKIWYAKISLESRCNGREVWGKVECVDVLTFPVESYEYFNCFTASV